MTNAERLALLLQVQLQAGNWREALEDLIEDAEVSTVADEATIDRHYTGMTGQY